MEAGFRRQCMSYSTPQMRFAYVCKLVSRICTHIVVCRLETTTDRHVCYFDQHRTNMLLAEDAWIMAFYDMAQQMATLLKGFSASRATQDTANNSLVNVSAIRIGVLLLRPKRLGENDEAFRFRQLLRKTEQEQ